MNRFEDFSYSQQVRAVVQTNLGDFHAFHDEETARARVTKYDDCVRGFWRLKERKA